MPDLTYDGFMRIAFVPTIANLASPTAVELNGGTSVDLTPYLTPDGFAFSADTGNVDNTKMNSTANSNRVGRRSYTLSVTYVRSTDVAGIAVETALTYKALGFLVVRKTIASGLTSGRRRRSRCTRSRSARPTRRRLLRIRCRRSRCRSRSPLTRRRSLRRPPSPDGVDRRDPGAG